MKADLIIRNAWVYRTYRQCFEQMDIAVAGERFYNISPAVHLEAETEIDGTGKYVVPGLIDIHMHIESSMTYPKEFSRKVLPHGVTCVVADPHEIANVFGIRGIRSFMNQETDLDIYYGIPSSVPATNLRLETPGATISDGEVQELLEDQRVLCLGEVMNYQDLISEEDTPVKRFIRLCGQSGRPVRIEGHCPSLTGDDCARFIYEGVDADHTQQTPESVLEKTDMGMFLELQTKSLTPDVVETVVKNSLYENVALVTDDTMPDHLMEGHLDRILRLAVKNGMPVEKAIYCATLTPARRMHLDDRGIIGPGKRADFIILNDLENFSIEAVYKNGKKYQPSEKELKGSQDQELFPEDFYHSVHCRPAEEKDFEVYGEGDFALVNAMEIQSFGTRAKWVKRQVPIRDGKLCWQEAGLCLAAVFERHGKSGGVGYGFAAGAFRSRGAVATTWSHDSHNLLVLGNSPEDMVIAQREILRIQGGYVAASGGEITASAHLPVGGILSDRPVEELAAELARVRCAIRDMGYVNNNEIMSISTLALLVSPELKISDKGMFDVKTQNPVPLIERTWTGEENESQNA